MLVELSRLDCFDADYLSGAADSSCFPHKAKTYAVDSAYEALRAATIAESLTRCLDATGNRGIGDEAPAPDVLYDFSLAYDAFAIFDEKTEERKHLRLDRDGYAVLPNLKLRRVDLKIEKCIDHAVIYAVSKLLQIVSRLSSSKCLACPIPLGSTTSGFSRRSKLVSNSAGVVACPASQFSFMAC
jgi:hypothetical protein